MRRGAGLCNRSPQDTMREQDIIKPFYVYSLIKLLLTRSINTDFPPLSKEAIWFAQHPIAFEFKFHSINGIWLSQNPLLSKPWIRSLDFIVSAVFYRVAATSLVRFVLALFWTPMAGGMWAVTVVISC